MSNYSQGKYLLTRLKKGDDLYNSLTGLVESNDIKTGKIEVIGAVSRAKIGYYDQQEREYRYQTLTDNLEIASCTGNISLKENKPMVHFMLILCWRMQKEALMGAILVKARWFLQPRYLFRK